MERPDPFEQVRLVLQRARRAGVPFEDAWDRALPLLGGYPRRQERKAGVLGSGEVNYGRALAALEATKAWWRAAYERRDLPERKPPKAAEPMSYEQVVALMKKKQRPSEGSSQCPAR